MWNLHGEHWKGTSCGNLGAMNCTWFLPTIGRTYRWYFLSGHTTNTNFAGRFTNVCVCTSLFALMDIPRMYLKMEHDDVIKWNHFAHCWPFVQEIRRSPVSSPHKGQWGGALVFSFICAWINGWVKNREAGDLRRHYAHYDVIVMKSNIYFDHNVLIERNFFISALVLRYDINIHIYIYDRLLCYLSIMYHRQSKLSEKHIVSFSYKTCKIGVVHEETNWPTEFKSL